MKSYKHAYQFIVHTIMRCFMIPYTYACVIYLNTFKHYFGYLTGRTVDFGYKPPKIYNYTFNIGSTCASPDEDILITDDMVKEDEESFKISIIDYSLPFGVMSGGPATITINDNDSKCS